MSKKLLIITSCLLLAFALLPQITLALTRNANLGTGLKPLTQVQSDDATATGIVTQPSVIFQNRVQKKEQILQRFEEKRQLIQQKLEENRESVRQRLQEKTKERVQLLFSRLIRRLRAAVNRLENIISRLNSRIDKFALKGLPNPDELKEKTASASAVLADVSGMIDASEAEFAAIVETETPRENFAEMKVVIQEIKAKLHQIHQILRDVVVELRAAVIKDTPEATSEAEPG